MTPRTERAEIATKPVVCQIPGMDAVSIQRDLRYQATDAVPLTMDLYRPPDSKAAGRLPAVVFVTGYPDPGAQKIFGCKLKEMECYISWAKLVAASGLSAITYLNHDPARDLDALFRHLRENAEALAIDERRMGVWSCSGNVPLALDVLMRDEHLKCAALCYGVMLDLDGSTSVAESARKFGFANPATGKSVRDLPPELPLFIARAGRDEPGLNETLDRFIAHALAANLPITLANHSTGPHAFDVLDDSETSREIIRQILAFLRRYLLA
jgi:acetyl esterase/lipase